MKNDNIKAFPPDLIYGIGNKKLEQGEIIGVTVTEHAIVYTLKVGDKITIVTNSDVLDYPYGKDKKDDSSSCSWFLDEETARLELGYRNSLKMGVLVITPHSDDEQFDNLMTNTMMEFVNEGKTVEEYAKYLHDLQHDLHSMNSTLNLMTSAYLENFKYQLSLKHVVDTTKFLPPR